MMLQRGQSLHGRPVQGRQRVVRATASLAAAARLDSNSDTPQDKPVQAQDRRRVLFRVPGAANLPRGWSISVVGNTPELGDWVPQFGKRLKRDSSGNVCVLLDLPAGAEFKLVQSSEAHETIVWETCKNRKLTVGENKPGCVWRVSVLWDIEKVQVDSVAEDKVKPVGAQPVSSSIVPAPIRKQLAPNTPQGNGQSTAPLSPPAQPATAAQAPTDLPTTTLANPTASNDDKHVAEGTVTCHVVLAVPEARLQPGQQYRLVGAPVQLGQWDAQRGLPLAPHGLHTVVGCVELQRGQTHECKAVLVQPCGRVDWESCTNRTLQLPETATTNGAPTDSTATDPQYAVLLAYNDPSAAHIVPYTPTSLDASPSVPLPAGLSADMSISVHHSPLSPSQELRLVGSVAQLGDWQADAGLRLTQRAGGGNTWEGSVTVPANTVAEAKLVVKEADGSYRWESGANRTITVSGTLTQLPSATTHINSYVTLCEAYSGLASVYAFPSAPAAPAQQSVAAPAEAPPAPHDKQRAEAAVATAKAVEDAASLAEAVTVPATAAVAPAAVAMDAAAPLTAAPAAAEMAAAVTVEAPAAAAAEAPAPPVEPAEPGSAPAPALVTAASATETAVPAAAAAAAAGTAAAAVTAEPAPAPVAAAPATAEPQYTLIEAQTAAGLAVGVLGPAEISELAAGAAAIVQPAAAAQPATPAAAAQPAPASAAPTAAMEAVSSEQPVPQTVPVTVPSGVVPSLPAQEDELLDVFLKLLFSSISTGDATRAQVRAAARAAAAAGPDVALVTLQQLSEEITQLRSEINDMTVPTTSTAEAEQEQSGLPTGPWVPVLRYPMANTTPTNTQPLAASTASAPAAQTSEPQPVKAQPSPLAPAVAAAAAADAQSIAPAAAALVAAAAVEDSCAAQKPALTDEVAAEEMPAVTEAAAQAASQLDGAAAAEPDDIVAPTQAAAQAPAPAAAAVEAAPAVPAAAVSAADVVTAAALELITRNTAEADAPVAQESGAAPADEPSAQEKVPQRILAGKSLRVRREGTRSPRRKSPSPRLLGGPPEGMQCHEANLLAILAMYPNRTVDQLQEMMEASTVEPKYEKPVSALSSLLTYLVASGTVTSDTQGHYKLRDMTVPKPRRRSSSPRSAKAAAAAVTPGWPSDPPTVETLGPGAQVISDGVISLLSQEGTLSSARLCELLPPALASAQTTQLSLDTDTVEAVLAAMTRSSQLVCSGELYTLAALPPAAPAAAAAAAADTEPQAGAMPAAAAPKTRRRRSVAKAPASTPQPAETAAIEPAADSAAVAAADTPTADVAVTAGTEVTVAAAAEGATVGAAVPAEGLTAVSAATADAVLAAASEPDAVDAAAAVTKPVKAGRKKKASAPPSTKAQDAPPSALAAAAAADAESVIALLPALPVAGSAPAPKAPAPAPESEQLSESKAVVKETAGRGKGVKRSGKGFGRTTVPRAQSDTSKKSA